MPPNPYATSASAGLFFDFDFDAANVHQSQGMGKYEAVGAGKARLWLLRLVPRNDDRPSSHGGRICLVRANVMSVVKEYSTEILLGV